MPSRQEAYAALDSERDFQDRMTADPSRPDMVENFSAGDALLAMEHNIAEARRAWYRDSGPDFAATAEFVRKVGGLSVKFMEQFSAPKREG